MDKDNLKRGGPTMTDSAITMMGVWMLGSVALAGAIMIVSQLPI